MEIRKDSACGAQYYALLASSASAAVMLQRNIPGINRYDLLLAAVMWFAYALIFGGSNGRFPIISVLLPCTIISAAAMMLQLTALMNSTGFCRAGSGFAAAVLLLLCRMVWSRDTAGVLRICVLGAASLFVIGMLFIIFGKHIIVPFRIADASTAAHSASAAFLNPLLITMPLAFFGKGRNQTAAGLLLFGLPKLLIFLAAMVLGPLLSELDFPVCAALTCMDSELLQGIEAVVMSCLLFMVFVHLAVCCAYCKGVAELLECRTRHAGHFICAALVLPVLVLQERHVNLLYAAQTALLTAALFGALFNRFRRRKMNYEQ